MATSKWLALMVGLLSTGVFSASVWACCAVHRWNEPVVNADQTVIMIWDPQTKMQHFIRQASFQSQADDFGFLVPSPTQPELSESGNEAFPYLLNLTKPEVETRRGSSNISCGCGGTLSAPGMAGSDVRVLEEKHVAGFHAAVLEAGSANALVGWLKEKGYAFSPEVEAWAKPYIDAGWKITALKVAKEPGEIANKRVAAAALRMSFHTEQPVFPYREPDSKRAAQTLEAKSRILRIFFISDARYQGELMPGGKWSAHVAWANKVKGDDRKKILELLKLPPNNGPAEWWLTEFEDNWQYATAPGDVYFSRDADQSTVKRPVHIQYVAAPWPMDFMVLALAAAFALPPLIRRGRR